MANERVNYVITAIDQSDVTVAEAATKYNSNAAIEPASVCESTECDLLYLAITDDDFAPSNCSSTVIVFSENVVSDDQLGLISASNESTASILPSVGDNVTIAAQERNCQMESTEIGNCTV